MPEKFLWRYHPTYTQHAQFSIRANCILQVLKRSSTHSFLTSLVTYSGQVDDREEEVVYKKPRVLDLLLTHKITSVSVGLHHVVAVNSNGCALSFGNNECGQLGHSPHIISHVPPRTVNFKCRGNKSAIVIKKALAGDLFTLLLTTRC